MWSGFDINEVQGYTGIGLSVTHTPHHSDTDSLWVKVDPISVSKIELYIDIGKKWFPDYNM